MSPSDHNHQLQNPTKGQKIDAKLMLNARTHVNRRSCDQTESQALPSWYNEAVEIHSGTFDSISDV